jgi:RNA polymerase sigma factor (sigma-70 family)
MKPGEEMSFDFPLKIVGFFLLPLLQPTWASQNSTAQQCFYFFYALGLESLDGEMSPLDELDLSQPPLPSPEEKFEGPFTPERLHSLFISRNGKANGDENMVHLLRYRQLLFRNTGRERMKFEVLARLMRWKERGLNQEGQVVEAKRIRKDLDELTQIRESIVSRNQALVRSIALDFAPPFFHGFMDLIQEGNLGLLAAWDDFDFKKMDDGFSTYAGLRIRWKISDLIKAQYFSLVKGPTLERAEVRALRKELKLFEAMGLVPTEELLAERLKMPLERVQYFLKTLRGLSVVSLDQPKEPGETHQSSQLDADVSVNGKSSDHAHHLLTLDIIQNFVSELKPVERFVFEEHIMKQRTQQEVFEDLRKRGVDYTHRYSVGAMKKRLMIRLQKRLRTTLHEEVFAGEK